MKLNKRLNHFLINRTVNGEHTLHRFIDQQNENLSGNNFNRLLNIEDIFSIHIHVHVLGI